ncbi:hypothetical protein BRADI_2g61965v3 [Brachypodium distachyon]|uniref:Uncharacterized protein n=1 Tax=Brachypodium distachyon TaxID=15368 RepID=A0A0Q3JHA2_BRADI|nr:hypothetical protein BRADI_2g61965v3 [Brachypodium distachyon]
MRAARKAGRAEGEVDDPRIGDWAGPQLELGFGPGGTNHIQTQQKHVKFQDNHGNATEKDEVNKDVDTVASDFIKRKHMSWALQKSTTIYQAS